eukprot:TRINITY_DN16038_c0_g1_i1.p1 TRINITY_DN16038_c0_g1~~TRINITY_DN16038_c0_g1_i1.p1  ORF type:complete len:473 (-),score=104.60 TRINITY_DN16038_c0_g1_i1:223-1641(-)
MAKLQAPEWFRDAKGPAGLKPLPPSTIPDGRPPEGATLGKAAPLGRLGSVPALPSIPAAPSTALAVQPQAQPPPLPALAVLPPPPGGGVHGQAVAVRKPPASAYEIMELRNKGNQAMAVQSKAKVKAAPMDSEKAFVIPGLQARPYLSEELAVAFEIIDLDRHGEIGAPDIHRALALCGESEPSDQEVAEMIRLMDPDGSGSVEFAEFRKYFIDPPPLFRNFDLHRRGGGDMDLESEDQPEEVRKASSKSEQYGDLEMALLFNAPKPAPKKAAINDKRKRFASRTKTKDNSESDPRIQYIPLIAKKGGLTPEFIRQIYQKFIDIDVADSGYMSFQAFCTVLGKPPSAVMREMFDAFDAEREGELDLRQFVIGLSMFATSGTEEKVRFAFMMYDEDQEGSISREDLGELLRAMVPYMRGPHREAHVERIYAANTFHPGARIAYEELMDYVIENEEFLLPQFGNQTTEQAALTE